jgi:mono/diheme cytochrome c family protein
VASRLFFALSASLAAAADVSLDAPALLARRCAACHNAAKKTSGLDLTSREAALRGGSQRGGLDLMLRRVRLGQMPPEGALPAAERELLARWVETGAPWTVREWWSLQPLRAASKSIDQWVMEKLRENGLTMSPPADRRTLIRRVTYGLTGLPPTPEEVESFVNDASPAAYEKLVDRLLASPSYGERWARHWLDVVRFTESEGFERDVAREHAWRYRDYVIRSFNQDKPYIQFAREQIAGDVLDPGSREGIIATGLLVFGPTDAVGLTSAVEREREAVREDQLEEMAGVVSQTFLGLTANCARCHDHKFDPIPQVDYYRFKAALSGVWQPFDDPAAIDLFPDGRALDAGHEEKASALKARIRAVDERIAALHRSAPVWKAARPVAHWTFDVDVRDQIGSLHAALTTKTQLRNGSFQIGADKPVTLVTAPLTSNIVEKTLEAWVTVRKALTGPVNVMQISNRSGYRGAASDGIQFGGGTSGQWRNLSTANFRTADVNGPKETAAAGERIHLAITYASDGAIRLYRNGRSYGEPYRPDAGINGRTQTYGAGDAVLKFTASPELELDEARLYDTALPEEQVAASFAAGPAEEMRPRGGSENLFEERRRLLAEFDALPPPDKAFAAAPRDPGITHLLLRGDVSRKAEALAPGGLSAIGGAAFGLAPDSPDADRRRRLALWIANPDNPIFSRVIVNRVWTQHFGAGIAENPNDLGANGGLPSHPELLDTLARGLIGSGWSLKALHRTIVLSAAYRQSSDYNASAAAKDASNRLLWRFTPRRLEGEAVRDAMLAVSGKLNREMGGPSFRPFKITKPGGSYVKYEPLDSGDAGLQRRSVYRMNVNTGGDPMLESLDCPVPAVKTPKRPSTTTALQALSLMNNPLSVRLSKAFAARVAAEAGGIDAQIGRAFALAFGRAPSPSERESSRALIADQSLEALCWGLFNASEFVYVE